MYNPTFMSIESFRAIPGDDVVKMVSAENQIDKVLGRAFSLYHSLGLILKAEGTDGLKHRRRIDGKTNDPDLNHAAIVFGVSMRTIELAFKNGEFDSYDLISYYNEAVVGVRKIDTFETKQVAPEVLPKAKLEEMGRYSKLDKTHAIFFLNYQAYSSLPDGLIRFITWTGTKKNIRDRVIPVYNNLAELISASSTPKALEPFRALDIPSNLSRNERNSMKQWEKMWKDAEKLENPE